MHDNLLKSCSILRACPTCQSTILYDENGKGDDGDDDGAVVDADVHDEIHSLSLLWRLTEENNAGNLWNNVQYYSDSLLNPMVLVLLVHFQLNRDRQVNFHHDVKDSYQLFS